jgi:hypothetical protein
LAFWQERDILDKRFNFPSEEKTGLKKTDYLFGFDDIEPNTDIIVVESIFNKLSVGEDCVASGGASLAGRQVQKLKALNPRRIILAPDYDKAGLESLVHNYFLLKSHFKLGYCLPMKDEDWNDMKKNNRDIRFYLTQNIRNFDLVALMKIKERQQQLTAIKNRIPI